MTKRGVERAGGARTGHGRPDTGVGTLDRAVSILAAVEAGAHRFTKIMTATGLPRGTAHRLIRALEEHGFLAHYEGFGYRLGPELLRLANRAMRELPLRDIAHPVLQRLAGMTGESAQLYVRAGDARVCVDAIESANELRTIVPVGASLPLTAGSAAKVFLAFDPNPQSLIRRAADPERFAREVQLVRTRGWASSTDERQRGVGSVSAPIVGEYDIVLGVVSVSGPSARMGRISARRYAPAVTESAREIERALGR
ncbi:MAG: IclR family transcriptional regulator [Actinomycetota bacterium]